MSLKANLFHKVFCCKEFKAEDLVTWLAIRSHSVGAHLALSELERYLDEDYIEIVSSVWIEGIRITEPVALVDGYRLTDLREVPDCFAKQVLLNNCDPRFPTVAACIKKDSYPKSIDKENMQEVKRVNSRLMNNLLKLNTLASVFALNENCKPKVIFQGNLIPNDRPFGLNMNVEGAMDPSLGNLFVSVKDCAVIGENSPFIDTIRSILDSSCLNKKQLGKCMKAMNRIAKSKETKELDDKILDLSIALELLLLDDNDHGELNYRLSERGAILLGHNSNDRLNIYKDLKKLYGERSNVVHSGEVKKYTIEEFNRCVGYSEKICIYKLTNGEIDWDKLVIGGEIESDCLVRKQCSASNDEQVPFS